MADKKDSPPPPNSNMRLNDPAGEGSNASPKFSVWYIGSMSMHRLYSQTMQPWVMAEIRRKRESCQEVLIEVVNDTLSVTSVGPREDDSPKKIFEHQLYGLTRFAKLHQDPRCFAYLTRYQPNADFECHVYLANSEEIIPQIFRAIRDASKDAHQKPTATPAPITTEEASHREQMKSYYEVKYMGRARVNNKKVTGEYIDSLAEKMIARDEDQAMKRLVEIEERENRRRHASMPDTLDSTNISMENKLMTQKALLQKSNSKDSIDELASNSDSCDNLSEMDATLSPLSNRSGRNQIGQIPSLHVDFHCDSDSSRDNLYMGHRQSIDSIKSVDSEASARSVQFPLSPLVKSKPDNSTRRRHSSTEETRNSFLKTSSLDSDATRNRRPSGGSDTNSGGSNSGLVSDANRIMVFQISHESIALICLDKKTTILERKFKDISFVSQGGQKQDMFGIVVRESSSNFICYIVQCLSEAVVTDIMSTLQTAFAAAYNKSGAVAASSGDVGPTAMPGGAQTGTSQTQMCTMCPLHQLHKLCQEINGLTPQATHDLLLKKLESLPEKELNIVRRKAQPGTSVSLEELVENETPESFEESVEVIMICLRQLCERKQREHVHISEGARPGKVDINLLEEKHNLFEDLRNKAKRSLTTSFENLLHRGRKKDEIREGFRQRSWTTDSEASWPSRDSSSATSTPEASPMPSPMSKEFPLHDFANSPPGSPRNTPPMTRQRSLTMDSPRAVARQTGLPAVRPRDVNHNTKTSPVKSVHLLSSPGPGESGPSSMVSSPLDDHSLLVGGSNSTLSPSQHLLHPHRRPSAITSSWRKAIFARVCTPQHSMDHGEEYHEGKLTNPEEIRGMWKKAILETLLLIRMEKENHHIRAREEEGGEHSCTKLDYEELTPCLKEITSIWEEMLALHEGSESSDGGGDENHPTVPSTKLLDCVKTGVPRALRGQIWLFLMQQRQMSSKVPETNRPDQSNYEDLLKQLTTHQHAILIDLGRTFPSHPYFSKSLGQGQLELFNLLKAYSLLDTEVGYCQGLSFIVGLLLMHMEEISAFHVLKYMMYDLGLRKQFRPNMMALQVKLYQLTRLIHDHNKELYDHFEEHEISPTLYAAPWFLTLFASQFPLGFVARVFDMLFVQGIDALFKVALMLLANHQALILQCNSFESTVDFLKTTLPEMVQVQMERIINQAFDLDISRELQAYEVEYHVLSEEMIFSPQPHHHHHHHRHHHHQMQHTRSLQDDGPTRLADRRRSSIDLEMLMHLEQQNRGLKQQNMELLEKLQHVQSQQRSSEHAIHSHQIEQDKLKSHIRTLELERAALLTAVAKLRKLVPREALQSLNLSLPQLPPSTPSSPAVPAPDFPSFKSPTEPSKEDSVPSEAKMGSEGNSPVGVEGSVSSKAGFQISHDSSRSPSSNVPLVSTGNKSSVSRELDFQQHGSNKGGGSSGEPSSGVTAKSPNGRLARSNSGSNNIASFRTLSGAPLEFPTSPTANSGAALNVHRSPSSSLAQQSPRTSPSRTQKSPDLLPGQIRKFGDKPRPDPS